jgi:hypothetical protein
MLHAYMQHSKAEESTANTKVAVTESSPTVHRHTKVSHLYYIYDLIMFISGRFIRLGLQGLVLEPTCNRRSTSSFTVLQSSAVNRL